MVLHQPFLQQSARFAALIFTELLIARACHKRGTENARLITKLGG